MGKKNKKKKTRVESVVNPLLEDAKTLDKGDTMTVEQMLDDYVLPSLKAMSRRPSTVDALTRNIRTWSQWWATVASEKLVLSKVRRVHLERFREWMAEQGKSTHAQNYAIRSVIQVLNAARKNEFIVSVPFLEAIPRNDAAPKIFPSADEIEKLWDAAERMRWPTRDSRRRPLPYSPATAWRCFLVMVSTYGFRTQELVQLEAGFRSLKWSNVYGAGLTPNPEGRAESQFGWISYIPQKQERVKWQPVVVPLTKYALAVLDVLGRDQAISDNAVFDWPLSSVSFYAEWHRLFDVAGIYPRETSGVDRYCPKHLRKFATTTINNHRPGIAQYVVGHAGDRSGQDSMISAKHYNNPETAVVECMESMEYPQCFSELLDIAGSKINV